MEQLLTFPTEELQQDTVYMTIAMELHASTLTNDKDRIEFENLISEARKKLNNSDLDEKEQLLEQLDVLMNHRDTLIQFIGGLAIYVTPEDIYFYHLAIPVNSRVQISKLPYVLPLASNFQYTRDYHLLVLNKESIRLFEGHSGRIEELPLDEIEDAPVDLETALGTEKDKSSLTYGSYSGGFAQGGNRGGAGQAFHGHGDVSEEKDIDRERYFQIVDDFVYNEFSNKKKLPLIIYSIEDNQAVFQEISQNEYLADTGISGSAANMKASEIEERAAQTIDEIIAHQRNDLLEELKETSPENRIENIPDDLASASLQGRIEKLYLEKGFEIPGCINEEGLYDADDESNDFIDQLVHNVIQTQGEVYILDPTETPDDTQVAARLRY
jgi:hypothetical protein